MGNREVKLSFLESCLRAKVQKYNHNKYWKWRQIVVNPDQGTKIGKVLKLYYIKRADAFSNASMGTHMGYGAQFASPPNLPHGLYGIIISHNAVIGYNCTIFHQVTIGEGRGGAPTIGNNVLIGAGSKIIGGIKVGNNVKIGAGCVIMNDIPDNAVVIAPPPICKIKNERF